MIKGYNISPLPFYDNLSKQFANHACAFGVNYPLLCYERDLLPFVFYVDGEGDEWVIRNASLVYVDDGTTTDITSDLVGHGLRKVDNCIFYYPTGIFTLIYPSVGNYYLTITTQDTDVPEGETHTYYSEVFCVTDRIEDAIQITYTSPINLQTQFGEVPFNDGNGDNIFKFRVWLNALIGKPEYNFEEVETNRNGYSFLERCTSKKTYRFTVIAPEYLCDALRLVKLCSEVVIRHKGKTYEPITFDMNVRWEEQGDLASVSMSFDTDNILTSIGGYIRESI